LEVVVTGKVSGDAPKYPDLTLRLQQPMVQDNTYVAPRFPLQLTQPAFGSPFSFQIPNNLTANGQTDADAQVVTFSKTPREVPKRYEPPDAKIVSDFRALHGRSVLRPAAAEALAREVLAAMGEAPADGSAVQALQRLIGAYPDGKFGPQTWAKAKAMLTEQGGDAALAAIAALDLPTVGGGTTAPVVTDPVVTEPAGPTEDEIYAQLVESTSASVEKHIADASGGQKDNVAYNAITTAGTLMYLKPSTVALCLKEMMDGYTGDDEEEAIMVGIRAMAAQGTLGQMFDHLNSMNWLTDLSDELPTNLFDELKTYATNPASGATASHLGKLGIS
jgi:hypothetical protein